MQVSARVDLQTKQNYDVLENMGNSSLGLKKYESQLWKLCGGRQLGYTSWTFDAVILTVGKNVTGGKQQPPASCLAAQNNLFVATIFVD